MKGMQTVVGTLVLTLLIPASLYGIRKGPSPSDGTAEFRSDSLAKIMETSLQHYILECWYPRNLDTVFGGFVSGFTRDWKRGDLDQQKSLVQQARHTWTTSFVFEQYPGKSEYLEYATHGFRFLRDVLWDQEYGGFYAFCNEDGSQVRGRTMGKRIYGQAFAVYGLSRYYEVSRDIQALDLARKTFFWMEQHAHDESYGGYFEVLNRNGDPTGEADGKQPGFGDEPGVELKDYNSSIHLMEAFTSLYRIWPDSLVRIRLEEMFYLIRDTFVHPDGYLQLYFYPDWKLVPDNPHFSQHITYGHDVETAFLLLETAHALGLEDDKKTHAIAKRLVDHSLESGWDEEVGGFFDTGRIIGQEIRITSTHKAWWSQVEGLNALLMMHLLYPDDPHDYYQKFLRMWEYIDTYLIDKDYGGWYNYGLDTTPESRDEPKSHIWKATYHNVRGMIHCIRMLQELGAACP